MYNLTDVMFWISLLGIFVSFFIAFYIPGRVIIGNHKIEQKNALHVISIIVGITLWAWQGYLFGLMHLRVLSYVYLIVFVGLFLFKKYYRDMKPSLQSFKKIDFIILIIAIFGIGAQILPYLQMGVKTQDGVTLVNFNRIDHIWHAGLVRELVDHFPPNEPGMSGVILKDYHYWFNLTTADLIRVFHLPLFQTQFIGMYSLASVLLLFIGYYFAKLIYNKKIFIRLFLFFLFFSGDAALWVMLIWQHKLTLSLSSLINDSTKFLDRPVFAYSMLIGLTAFYLLFQTKEKLSKKMILICALLFGSLLEFKVYTGITFMLGLGAFACYSFFKRRFDRVAVFICASLLGAFIFFPNTSSSSGLVFLPFEIPRDFITQSILGLRDWELRWRIYQDNANYIRIAQYGMYMTGLYFLIQFGVLLAGLIPLKKTVQSLSLDRAIPLFTIVLSGMFLGIFFYQTVGGANIWEFFLPVLIILSLLSALTITLLVETKKRLIRTIVIIALIVIVLPRWLVTVPNRFMTEYLTGFHGITNDEYLSYAYLEKNVSKNDVVMIVSDPPEVSYVSIAKIFSGAQFYLSGEGVSQRVTLEMIRRRAVMKLVFRGNNENQFAILNKENVRYLYYYGEVPEIMQKNMQGQIVFHNQTATIIRLNQ